MTALVTAGCVLAALPLLLALALADHALRDSTRQAEVALEESLTLATLGGDLRDNLAHLERNARQYVALGDPQLLRLFDSRLHDLDDILRQLRRHPRLEVPAARLQQGLNEVSRAWAVNLQGHAPLSEVVTRIHSLGYEVIPIIAQARLAAKERSRQFRRDRERAQRHMLWAVLALLPLTALLGFGFSRVVTRPLRQMAQGVAALGHSRYERPIRVGFPQELQRLAERLDWLRQRLGTLEADKERFLRHVSHELKTPLASLRAGTGLLREGALGALSPRQQEVVQILVESATELEGLIDNLLAYAEWRRDCSRQPMEWFEARPLVEEVLASQRLSLARQRLRVELQIDTPQLFGRRQQLRVALDNLLTNAIKHAPPGSCIEIGTALRAGCCGLQVRDHGRGVAEHERQKIFEPFVRGSEAEESGIRGSGIGLSIVREAAQAHAGAVEVDDAAPGARFRLQWPLPEGLPDAAATA